MIGGKLGIILDEFKAVKNLLLLTRDRVHRAFIALRGQKCNSNVPQ